METRRAEPHDRAPHVVILLPGLGAGGAERVVSILANQWVSRGVPVSIVTFESAGTKPYYELDPRVQVQQIASPPARSLAPASLFKAVVRVIRLRATLRCLAPAVAISFLTRTNIQTLAAARGLKVPVIISERNNAVRQTLPLPWKWLRIQLYPEAFALVVITKGALASFPERTGRLSFVIPNPVQAPQNLQNLRGGKVLAAVGRLVHQKGFDLLLRAYAEVAAEHPDWTLTIWGEGPERAALEQLRHSLGLDTKVSLPGISARPGSWAETADAFVLSSRFEGWGNVLSEAMASGLPVVSFDCDWGPREMIEDGKSGLLVSPENIGALALALNLVLGDEALRARLGDAARIASRQFDILTVMRQWDHVVEQATGLTLPAHASANPP